MITFKVWEHKQGGDWFIDLNDFTVGPYADETAVTEGLIELIAYYRTSFCIQNEVSQ